MIGFGKCFVKKELEKESQGNDHNHVHFLSCSLLEQHGFSVPLEPELLSLVLTAQMVLPHIIAFLHHSAVVNSITSIVSLPQL